jgi:hypothetical protein
LIKSKVFSEGSKSQSTQPSSVGHYERTDGPLAMAMYNYSKSNNPAIDWDDSGLEFVMSSSDDALLQTEALPEVVAYQETSAQFIVKVLLKDQTFLQFQLDYSNTTDVYKHDTNCTTTSYERRHSTSPFYRCLPPEDRVDHEYLCRPAPRENPQKVPPTGAHRLKHYLQHPPMYRP